MVRRTFGRVAVVAWVMFLLAGCGQSTGTAEGEVTYEGQPVEKGQIAFLPADGKGPQAGGAIVNGRYRVADLAPGPKIVKIEGVKAVEFARSSEEMARLAAANKARGDASGIIERADIIPDDAENNNTSVDIKPGKQTLDFHLKKPPGARGK